MRISEKKLSIPNFFIFRLSRLYPLHFTMLILLVALQFIFLKISGQFFVYPSNNLKTFFESLFFIQGGGKRSAFNGPEWSLTIEILVYVIFFALARFKLLKNALVPFLMIIAGVGLHFIGTAIHKSITEDISRGLCGFFVGGLIFMLFQQMRNIQYARTIVIPLALIAVVGWLAVIVDIYDSRKVETIILSHISFSHSRYILHIIIIYGLFPITILSIALHEALYSARYQYISWLGEISYSSYLIHFPLQLIFALSVVSGILAPDAVRSPIGLIAYLIILIPLSLIVFRKFEVPIQNALRDRWARSGSNVK